MRTHFGEGTVIFQLDPSLFLLLKIGQTKPLQGIWKFRQFNDQAFLQQSVRQVLVHWPPLGLPIWKRYKAIAIGQTQQLQVLRRSLLKDRPQLIDIKTTGPVGKLAIETFSVQCKGAKGIGPFLPAGITRPRTSDLQALRHGLDQFRVKTGVLELVAQLHLYPLLGKTVAYPEKQRKDEKKSPGIL